MCGAANLYRQSAMSFNLYFHTLLSATLSQADGMSAQQVETAAPQQRHYGTATAPQHRHATPTLQHRNITHKLLFPSQQTYKRVNVFWGLL